MPWEYADTLPHVDESIIFATSCIYCGGAMDLVANTVSGAPITRLVECQQCGWWTYLRQWWSFPAIPDSGRPPGFETWGASGLLRLFDITNITEPVDEISRYLTGRCDATLSTHRRLLEETVKSVFESVGYVPEAAAHAENGATSIIILRKSGGTACGVQIKGSWDHTEVEQIQALTGALLVNGMLSGVFATTSEFPGDAGRRVTTSEARGMPIGLADAGRFFDALQISTQLEDEDPYYKISKMENIEAKRFWEDWKGGR